ncbi:hypothetical protein J6590_069451 [Homalodisca vitripennis]|nr:hypothetical protein J6590_069451 [Homalodisca vitripennis]
MNCSRYLYPCDITSLPDCSGIAFELTLLNEFAVEIPGDSDSFEDSDSTEETDHPFTNYLYNIFFYVVGAVLVYVVGVYIFGVEVDNDLENM